jgi:hypothetical protein
MYRVKQTTQPTFKRDERTEIFENKVTDKNLIQRNKLKTSMCKRMIDTGKCPYGAGCFYAHSKEELRRPICFFGDKCKNKDTCGYSHETTEIPELPKVEEVTKNFDRLKVSEPVKEGDFGIELQTDTFKTYSKERNESLEKLKALMQQSENDEFFREIMINTMKDYLQKTFTDENTVYIPSTGSKSVKFIAVECDDEQFEDIVKYTMEKVN